MLDCSARADPQATLRSALSTTSRYKGNTCVQKVRCTNFIMFVYASRAVSDVNSISIPFLLLEFELLLLQSLHLFTAAGSVYNVYTVMHHLAK
jgi:hypothetical protein